MESAAEAQMGTAVAGYAESYGSPLAFYKEVWYNHNRGESMGKLFAVKAYLVADVDFNGPLPVVRQFCIFSEEPSGQPGLGVGRMWATLMVREAPTFSEASAAIYAELESRPDYIVYATVLRLMDQAPDEATHALKHGLPRALDRYIATMPTPDHPFFKQVEG